MLLDGFEWVKLVRLKYENHRLVGVFRRLLVTAWDGLKLRKGGRYFRHKHHKKRLVGRFFVNPVKPLYINA
jgi:hypothetical protein